MARKAVARQPAPWPSLVLDSQGLLAVAANSEDARAALAATASAKVPALVPAVVLAECLRGGAVDAPIYQRLKGLTVVSIDGPIAIEAARLKAVARLSGIGPTVDALVVAVAIKFGGAAILTSDPRDMERLAEVRSDVPISVIRV
jgi:predicted nucleic acid-binding protein